MKNDDLTNVYDEVYEEGSNTFFSESDGEELKTIISMCEDWSGKRILEIGCGEGDLALELSDLGAEKIIAIDYSQSAINIALKKVNDRKNLIFRADNYKNIKGSFDYVVMAGVLEHFDNPFIELTYIMDEFVKEGGSIITSSPSFLNPRGYVWMTLAILLKVPMSLTDLHFLAPWQFEEFAKSNEYELEMKSCDFSWGCGKLMIKDYKKRLHNALRDANLDNTNVSELLDWMEKAGKYYNIGEYSGATMAYKITK